MLPNFRLYSCIERFGFAVTLYCETLNFFKGILKFPGIFWNFKGFSNFFTYFEWTPLSILLNQDIVAHFPCELFEIF